MSGPRFEVVTLASKYLVQHIAADKAATDEMMAFAVWSGAAAAVPKSGGPTEHERATRGAWLSARRQRQEEEDKLRAIGRAMDEAFAQWDRQGPAA
jgi:hypothetical protein